MNFPDYDVFSPNVWEHAKELSNILHERLNNSEFWELLKKHMLKQEVRYFK